MDPAANKLTGEVQGALAAEKISLRPPILQRPQSFQLCSSLQLRALSVPSTSSACCSSQPAEPAAATLLRPSSCSAHCRAHQPPASFLFSPLLQAQPCLQLQVRAPGVQERPCASSAGGVLPELGFPRAQHRSESSSRAEVSPTHSLPSSSPLPSPLLPPLPPPSCRPRCPGEG